MEKTPAVVRRQSIIGMARLDSMHRNDLKERIMKNELISAAKVRVVKRRAEREESKFAAKSSMIHSVIDHYYEDKGEIEKRFIKRLAKLNPTKPITPKLATQARAASKSTRTLKFGAPAKSAFGLAIDE